MGDTISAVELTRQLVRIPSENPTGSEAAISEFVARWMGRLPNVEVERHQVRPNRPNVVVRLPSGTGNPPLVLLAHTDTVPKGDGWTREPFGGEIADGRLYGRGACDMKSGLAVAMAAFARAAENLSDLQRDLLLCATVDEEGPAMLGAADLVERGLVDENSLIICTEPSDLRVVVAHKGVMWYEFEVLGRSAHAGNPHVGVDAIRAAAAFVHELYQAVSSLPYRHELLGGPTITFSRIQGGIKTNVVPDHARMEIDVRMVPPMTISELAGMIRGAARRAEDRVQGARIETRQMSVDRPPVEAAPDSPVVRALQAAVERTGGEGGSLSGFPAYTDAALIAARTGNPHAVVFGPGRLSEAHTIDEYVEIQQVERAEAILTDAVLGLCRRR